MRAIKYEKIKPSKVEGRCQVCATELASHVVEIERVFVLRFCDKCFETFKETINVKDSKK